MALTVTHAKNVAIADDPKAAAAGEVLPSDWNDDHVLTGFRSLLTAATDYYVSVTGSDSNPGTISQPWATIQHAFNFIAANIDANANTISIHVSVGTYVGPNITGWPPNLPSLALVGDPSDQTLVKIQDSGAGSCININAGTLAFMLVGSLTLDCNNVGTKGIDCESPMAGVFTGDINFSGNGISIINSSGGNAGYCFFFNTVGCGFFGVQDITVSGNRDGVYYVGNTGVLCGHGGNLIISGNPHWSVAFVEAFAGQMEIDGPIIGSSTGKALEVTEGASVSFNTGNALPGDSFGSMDSGQLQDSSANRASFFGKYPTSGPATTANLTLDTAAITKDITNGPRAITLNDGGVVYVKQIGRFVNTQTGSPYTLQLFDQDGRVEMNLAGANTLTVPLNASVAFPIGTEIRITQVGAGATTISGAGGVTVDNAGVVGGQWKSVMLYKRGTDEWVQTNV